MFISNDKFTKLREASRNGDEKAKEILKSFREGGDQPQEARPRLEGRSPR